MFECRIRENEYPEDGEIVLARTHAIEDGILTMKLVEYSDIPGLVLSSELSKRRVRSMHQITKVGNLEVCQVLKVDRAKGHIDLSLRSVGDRERAECLERIGKDKIAHQIMLKASKSAGVPVGELYERVGYALIRRHGSLYSYFARAKADPALVSQTEFGEHFKRVIDEHFTPATYRVRVDVDVHSFHGGVAHIKAAFGAAVADNPDVEIALLKTPVYSVTVVRPSKEDAFCDVERACNIIQARILETRGHFRVSNPPKVYGEKIKHNLLREDAAKKGAKEDSDEYSE